MRPYPAFLVVLALLLSAGCVEEVTPASVTTAQTTATTAPENTPVPTPSPAPVAVAFISGITCGIGDRSVDAYHCNGNIRIGTGAYENIQVIAMYADNNTFRSGPVSLGGNDAVSKPFVIFPNVKYKDQTPAYYVRLDGVTCPVIWSGTTGAAMTNMTVPEVVLLTS